MQGWEHKPLGSICSIARGGSPRPIQEFLTDAADGVNWIKISDATASGRYIYRTAEKIKPAGVVRSRLVKDGDFLLSNSMSFGRPYIMRTSGCIHDGWLVLSDYQKTFDQTFLYYVLGSPQVFSQFDRLAAGSTVRNLNIDLASRVVVPVPPLPEQRRIVAMLDEAFEAIATAKANTEKNLQNTAELRAAYLQSTFVEPKSGWIARKLGDLTSIQNGYAFKSGDYSATGHFVMRIGNVQDGEITLENPRFIELEGTGLERFALNEDDILVSLTGNIGRVGMIRSEHLPAALNQRVARITPKVSELNVEFLFKYLSSRAFRESLSNAGHGAAQQNVSTKEIEAVCIFVPPLSEQSKITERFVEFEAHFEVLDSNLRQRLLALDELRKSLLHQAFTGQLTAKTTDKQLEAVA